MNINEINALCAELAEEEQQNYLENTIDAFLAGQEELQNEELQKQYEMMSYADDSAFADVMAYME